MHRCSIEWLDYVWNPITGCRNKCEYCAARKQSLQQCGDRRLNMATAERWKDTDIFVLDKPFPARNNHSLPFPYGYEPTLHLYRMDNLSRRKVGAKILVGSMAEMFGDWIPDELLEMVFAECAKHPQHTFFFLTKNPARYLQLATSGKLPSGDNMWYGTTVTNEDTEYFYAADYKTFLNIEPLLEDFAPPGNLQTDWVIVGAETKGRPDPVQPQKEWVRHIAQDCEENGVPLFMRDNLAELMGDEFSQVFPNILTVAPELTMRQREILIGRCGMCKKEFPKKEMVALLAREARGQQPKGEGHLCQSCMGRLRDAIGKDAEWHIV